MDPFSPQALNPQQLEAVRRLEGPLLILAGAGSGKTRVITYRIAAMLERKIPESAILAVTFTNKAAREMSLRVRTLCGRKLPRLTVCTFHSLGARLLREHGEGIGVRPSFSIYDEGDRQSLIREAAGELGLTREGLDLPALVGMFSALKNGRLTWSEANLPFQPLFREYQERLRLHNAVDFDDLILLPIQLLRRDEEVLEKVQHRYRYLMVDEFQDTSGEQYRLMALLAAGSRHLCVVGDDDQSIYSWRGANPENIQWFERDFPEARLIKLERNYRSTGAILKAANHLISHNLRRKAKRLWTETGGGESIVLVESENEEEEARFIAETARALALKERLPLNEIAVLVRTNSLTRALEEAFRRENLPYQVSGGLSFFQRTEVKDVIAYLRVLANPEDDVSLLRILNVPRRGMGKKVLQAAAAEAGRQGCSLYSALTALTKAADSPLAEKLRPPLEEFLEMMERYRARLLAGKGMAGQLRALVEEIGYWGHLVQEHADGKIARWKYDNVEELAASLAAYEEDPDNLDPNLFDYLNRITLFSQEDGQEEAGPPRLQLMTIHAAKGLEFDSVFIAAVERDLLPHTRSLSENASNLEEERRLLYVAITRARRRLFISHAVSRRRRGSRQASTPSPFLEELPADVLVKSLEQSFLEPEEALRYLKDLKKRLG